MPQKLKLTDKYAKSIYRETEDLSYLNKET